MDGCAVRRSNREYCYPVCRIMAVSPSAGQGPLHALIPLHPFTSRLSSSLPRPCCGVSLNGECFLMTERRCDFLKGKWWVRGWRYPCPAPDVLVVSVSLRTFPLNLPQTLQNAEEGDSDEEDAKLRTFDPSTSGLCSPHLRSKIFEWQDSPCRSPCTPRL